MSTKRREKNKTYSLWKRRLETGRYVYYARFRIDGAGWSSAKSSGSSNKKEATAWAAAHISSGAHRAIAPELKPAGEQNRDGKHLTVRRKVKSGLTQDEANKLFSLSRDRYYVSARGLWKNHDDVYRSIVDTAAEAIIRSDARGHIVLANPYAATMLGYGDPSEMIGMRFLDIIAEADRSKIRATEKSRRAGHTDKREVSLRRKDGSRLSARIVSSPLFDGKRFTGTLAMARDIDDEKIAMHVKLKLTERRLTDMADKFPIAICAIGLDSCVKYMNSSGEDLFGLSSKGPLELQSLRDYVPADARMRYDRALAAAIDRGETRSLIMDALVGPRERMPALWRFSPIAEVERILGSFVAIVDLGGSVMETNRLPSDSFYDAFGLTERERDIADQLLAGLQYKEIAACLSISLATTRTHVMNLYRKMGIHSSDELARNAARWQSSRASDD